MDSAQVPGPSSDRFPSGSHSCVSCDSRSKLRLLACFHRACVDCLDGHFMIIPEGGGIVCPRCNEVTKGYPSPLALPLCSSRKRKFSQKREGSEHDRTAELESAAEDSPEPKSKRNKPVNEVCDECLEESAATASHWCRDCDCALCDMHVSHHKKSRRTAKHKLARFVRTQQRRVHSTRTASARDQKADISDQGEECDVPTCPMHPAFPLLTLCKTCSVLICQRCESLARDTIAERSTFSRVRRI